MNATTLYILLGAALLFFALRRLGAGKVAPAAAVLEKIRSGARIIDVRTPAEFSGGAYPKAKNIPLDSLQSRLGDLGAKGSPLVVYCASGSRSAHAARLLKQAGFTDVLNAGALSGMPR